MLCGIRYIIESVDSVSRDDRDVTYNNYHNICNTLLLMSCDRGRITHGSTARTKSVSGSEQSSYERYFGVRQGNITVVITIVIKFWGLHENGDPGPHSHSDMGTP